MITVITVNHTQFCKVNIRDGMGMEIQIRVGYQTNFKYGSGTGLNDTLSENRQSDP